MPLYRILAEPPCWGHGEKIPGGPGSEAMGAVLYDYALCNIADDKGRNPLPAPTYYRQVIAFETYPGMMCNAT